MDEADARRRLWERYDAGEMTADEVEARLVMLERAGDDEGAQRDALEGPVPLRQRVRARRVVVIAAALVGVALLATGAAAVATGGDDDGDGGDGSNGVTPTTFPGGVILEGDIAVPRPIPLPAPETTIVDCPEREEPDSADEPAANPALLSDPPFLPEGYESDGDQDIVPGNDDATMTISAGNPLPVEILARALVGDLPVRMRTFRYADAEEASASSEDSFRAACQYAPAYFDIPEHPEIGGAVVSGVIPETAFASWQLGDRRFIVAVESNGALEEAQDLAGEIATAELVAARTAPEG